ncbi:MAG: putative cytokinetic ring protein SteA [Mycobacteriales bacterium]|nr:thiamine pyrophosphokinase [Frankia sp.]
MKLALRRHRAPAVAGLVGTVRLDRRTKDLTRRLRPGEIAVIDHTDLDRVSAEALITAGARGVVNAAASISGRYPNLGPEILVRAGVPLVDDVGADVFADVREGDIVRLDGAKLWRNDEVVAHGTLQTAETVAAQMAEARAGLATQLAAFASNTMEYIRREQALLFDGVGVPRLRTRLDGRHALVVVRGYDYREDLATLRPYIREYRPVLIGVDGGADALREVGYLPDVIVGDMDSVTTETLLGSRRHRPEIVVHAYPDGRAPGLARVEDLGLEAVTFSATGTSEDVALLLADELHASLIVAVGSHATLGEFLDKGRAGMSSTFLTRLRVGSKLVDAKGVSRLYRSRIRASALLLLVLATLVTFAIAVAISGVGRTYVSLLDDKWDSFTFWIREIVR